MYLVGLLVLPVIVLAVLLLATTGDDRTLNTALRAALRERGLGDPVEAPRTTSLSVGGVIDGVGVVVQRTFSRAEGQALEVRASRDLAAILPSRATPSSAPGYRDGAPPSAPIPELTSEECRKLAEESLAAITTQPVVIGREGDVARVRVKGTECSRALVDRAVDAALALVDDRRVAPAVDADTPEVDPERTFSFGVGLLFAFVLSLVGVSCSSTARGALSPFSCRTGETLEVLVEETHDGTGYTCYCASRDGERHWYGCVTSFASGFDVTFPIAYAGAFAAFALRRRRRRRF